MEVRRFGWEKSRYNGVVEEVTQESGGRAKRIAKSVVVSGFALPLLWFLLAPFPGMALIYSITDPLRGHPESKHGTNPKSFIGLWVKEEPVEFGFTSNSLAFVEDGSFARRSGTSRRSWHYDDSRLSFDRVSGCGNCYRGVVTSDFSVEFEGNDRMKLTQVANGYERDVKGWYRRTKITEELKTRMTLQAKLEDYTLMSQATSILDAIEQLSKRTSN